MPGQPDSTRATFLVELIKPSHYDEQGYVIQWRRGFIPSNTLSSVYGLVLDAQRRRILGERIDIQIRVRDEINSVIPIKRIIREFKGNGNCGIVCFVGVQTNQYARALDLAKPLRAAGIQVVFGGWHVSGCIAMLPELPPEIKEALALGITVFAGEAEGRLDGLFQAAYERRLQPVYNFLNDLPQMEGRPLPFLPLREVQRYAGWQGSFDTGRGCPFACSFCTIINVQGRKSRFRTPDDVERIVRSNYEQGVTSLFVTDDDFARNKNWEEILDRLIELRERDGVKISFMLQVDALCHKIPNFIAKAARAGCDRVFIGLENINPESLRTIDKGQNRITEYRKMLQAWRNVDVLTYIGYILGFPSDTPDSIARDILIIQRELPIDILQFFVLTPLPGSKDHRDLYLKGARLETDTNKYDTEHVTTDHPLMTTEAWQATYQRAWLLYYTMEHMETLLKRAVASRMSAATLSWTLFPYYASHVFERVHPLQSGLFRRKLRTQRRPTFPRESAVVFYPRRLKEIVGTYVPALWFFLKLERLRKRIERDPAARSYTDIAIAPAADDRDESLALYQHSEAARRTVAQSRSRAVAAVRTSDSPNL